MNENNDRFRFRVWDKQIKRILIASKDVSCIMEDVIWNLSLPEYVSFDWNTFIVMQCTGLHDSEGKLIWEGDIIETITEGGDYIMIWKNGGFMLDCPGAIMSNGKQACLPIPPDLENYGELSFKVIGNIYENANLLKEVSNGLQEEK